MKKRKTTFILVLFFFVGILILTYPMISDYFNQKTQSRVITNYESLLNNVYKKDYTDEFNKAYDYNNKLAHLSNPLLTYDTLNNYNEILNINLNGMIGYITIDKIKIELPIYHGTSKEVLSSSVGHIEGTSLPVGGSYTNSVLSAHRGLPSSKLFTDLDKLELKDTFTITVLDKVLTYEVDKIVIVKPNEVEELKIDENDYVILSTCTPYGINTHRLLVRGKRIENITVKNKYITTEAFKIDNLIVTPLVAIPIILILLLIIVFKPVQKTKLNIDKYIYPSKKEDK